MLSEQTVDRHRRSTKQALLVSPVQQLVILPTKSNETNNQDFPQFKKNKTKSQPNKKPECLARNHSELVRLLLDENVCV